MLNRLRLIESVMRDKGFFIGWKAEVPEDISEYYHRLKWPFFLALPILIFLLVWMQEPFNDHQFELGTLTEVTGIYYDYPVPILVADAGSLRKDLSSTILLVGYGKFGANGILKELSTQHGSLNGKKITLSGTLIYGDGKTLLELTEKKGSLKKVVKEYEGDLAKLRGRSPVALSGEVIDPKCYFGVMKPSSGKTHKSCAIRCISGGIPPVFRHETGNRNQPYRYYLMLNKNSDKINRDILPFVGERMNIRGNASEFLGWDIVHVDLAQLR